MSIEPPLSRAVGLTFAPKQNTDTLSSAFYSSHAGLPDEAVKHVAKSPSVNIGDEARSAKLVLDLLIPAKTKSPISVNICRLSLDFKSPVLRVTFTARRAHCDE